MSESASILIVDDEPNVRLVFRTALESRGYRITTADDGSAAIDILKEPGIDLVLLDLQMPVMDGMQALETLREAGSNVPVVVVTAHGSVPDAVRAMKLGAIDFLSKPLSPETLRRVVAEVLDRHATGPGPHDRTDAPVAPVSTRDLAIVAAKRALNDRKFDVAEVHLKQAIAQKPNEAELRNLLGVLHELKGEHDESYREYRAALKADHHYEPARNNMTRYYERFTFGRSEIPLDAGP